MISFRFQKNGKYIEYGIIYIIRRSLAFFYSFAIFFVLGVICLNFLTGKNIFTKPLFFQKIVENTTKYSTLGFSQEQNFLAKQVISIFFTSSVIWSAANFIQFAGAATPFSSLFWLYN